MRWLVASTSHEIAASVCSLRRSGGQSLTSAPSPASEQGTFDCTVQDRSVEKSDLMHAPLGQSASEWHGAQTEPSPTHAPARGKQNMSSPEPPPPAQRASLAQFASLVHVDVQNLAPAASATQRCTLPAKVGQSMSLEHASQ
jgi:hypothetical protein